jgi:hypothetical protein
MVIDDTSKVVYVSPDGKVVDSFDAGGCESTVDAAGDVYVGGCVGPDPVIVYDAQHRKIGVGSGQTQSPVFGPGDEAVALGWDGSVNFLKVTLPAP